MTRTEKEKELKRICKKEMLSAWEWGGKEMKAKMEGRDTTEPFARFKKSFPSDLTRALKKAGVLPL